MTMVDFDGRLFTALADPYVESGLEFQKFPLEIVSPYALGATSGLGLGGQDLIITLADPSALVAFSIAAKADTEVIAEDNSKNVLDRRSLSPSNAVQRTFVVSAAGNIRRIRIVCSDQGSSLVDVRTV